MSDLTIEARLYWGWPGGPYDDIGDRPEVVWCDEHREMETEDTYHRRHRAAS